MLNLGSCQLTLLGLGKKLGLSGFEPRTSVKSYHATDLRANLWINLRTVSPGEESSSWPARAAARSTLATTVVVAVDVIVDNEDLLEN